MVNLRSERVSHYSLGCTFGRTKRLLVSGGIRGENRIRVSAPRLAESLEAVLFAKSNTADEHSDPDFVNERLKGLVQVLQQRRKRKAEKIAAQRQELLQKVLGHKRHKKVKRLVDEVKLARLEKASEGCAQCKITENGTFMCPAPTNGFPYAVKQLFFGVELVHAIELRPPETWKDNNWENLIEQAEQILREYRVWRELMAAVADENGGGGDTDVPDENVGDGS